MRKSLAVTVIILVGLTATAVSALADTRDFSLRNRTSFRITGFWFSTPGLDQWIPMRGETISAGESRDVYFDRTGPCALQFRVQTSSGRFAEFTRPFDFCSIRSIGIYYDADDDIFTARPE